MGLFRKKSPVQAMPPRGPEPSQASTTFVGISADTLDGRSTLYEFSTENGVPVRLHDMVFVGLEYRVDEARLTLRFLYDDPQWTPAEAAATPLAVFRFKSVRVSEWVDETDLPDAPTGVRGQVSSFDHSAGVFSLVTISTTLEFTANRLVVTLEPLPVG